MQLSGMKQIAAHINRSEPTVLVLIRDYDFPAWKAMGIWESDTDLIHEWRLEQIRKNRGLTEAQPAGQKPPASEKPQNTARKVTKSTRPKTAKSEKKETVLS